jgi:hypothetical protein
MLHEQQQKISMRSNVRERTHALLVNTPCSHLHSFCATVVSSSLATRVTLTRVSRGCWESLTRGWTCFLFYFCTVVRLTAANMKMAVFWVVTPCSLVEVYQRFRGTCYLRHQGDGMMEAASTSETLVNFYQTT